MEQQLKKRGRGDPGSSPVRLAGFLLGASPKKMETPSLELSAFNSKENPSYQQTWLSNT
jgi:hypothetical protein